MHLPLAQVQAASGAEILGPYSPPGLIKGWTIDSRAVAPGDLFFAVKGEHADGHGFVRDAFSKGAQAAVVSQQLDVSGALLKVNDTVDALGKIARAARRQWNRPIVAITGSAGKTSTKDIVADLLSVKFRVGKTVGNLNNHLGLPLSLLRLPDDAEVGVIEIGMNHAGEIRSLAAIAEPQIGVVTNVGYAHIEAFESIEGIAAAKRELIESLPETGVAVLNADDPRVLKFREAHPGRTLTYGFSESADIRATVEENGFTVDGVRFTTSLTGRHALSNILAGIAVASLFDIPAHALTEKVAALKPGKMRGERSVWREITIFNDCYNSNPEAAKRMLDVLRDEPAQRRIAVLGEMLELGRWAESLHRDVGLYAAHAGVDVVLGVRGVSKFLVEEARNAGLGVDAALFFEDPSQAGEFLQNFVQPGDAVLFKGSRGTHVERALDALLAAV